MAFLGTVFASVVPAFVVVVVWLARQLLRDYEF